MADVVLVAFIFRLVSCRAMRMGLQAPLFYENVPVYCESRACAQISVGDSPRNKAFFGNSLTVVFYILAAKV